MRERKKEREREREREREKEGEGGMNVVYLIAKHYSGYTAYFSNIDYEREALFFFFFIMKSKKITDLDSENFI